MRKLVRAEEHVRGERHDDVGLNLRRVFGGVRCLASVQACFRHGGRGDEAHAALCHALPCGREEGD